MFVLVFEKKKTREKIKIKVKNIKEEKGGIINEKLLIIRKERKKENYILRKNIFFYIYMEKLFQVIFFNFLK